MGLPVHNGAARIEHVVGSVLAQDHQNVELVICDNASTDSTEDLCRDLAARDERIVYHRRATDVGQLNNFVGALHLAQGTFFRWVSDDDWLAPNCISRCLAEFAIDDRLILVTTQVDYTGPDGRTSSARYDGTELGSDDPIARFSEMLRLQNESHLLMDPLYGVMRRARVLDIGRRNMLREDEVFAAKLALAGPWGHVPEVLARRTWHGDRSSILARRLGVAAWQAHFATTLQCRELLRYLSDCDLSENQRRTARRAVTRLYARRQQIRVARGGRRIAGHVSAIVTRPPTVSE
ncbi:glycosyltransferase family 2 protein [Rhodococcus zopfii]|uniref:glycosyltransferase family 2 protein n=1 Tax=Rhodococcus zopfii TaxID=43772 RepID=UPI00197F382C|nr:glycosyltransferase [Rhodococcus zopfii]